jgi:hypothetical protein
MQFRYICNCGAKLTAPLSAVGNKTTCPSCTCSFSVPEPEAKDNPNWEEELAKAEGLRVTKIQNYFDGYRAGIFQNRVCRVYVVEDQLFYFDAGKHKMSLSKAPSGSMFSQRRVSDKQTEIDADISRCKFSTYNTSDKKSLTQKAALSKKNHVIDLSSIMRVRFRNRKLFIEGEQLWGVMHLSWVQDGNKSLKICFTNISELQNAIALIVPIVGEDKSRVDVAIFEGNNNKKEFRTKNYEVLWLALLAVPLLILIAYILYSKDGLLAGK